MGFDINELKKMYNGDKEERLRFVTPSITFNGQSGKFYTMDSSFKNKTEIISPEVIFIGKRIKLSGMFKSGDKKVMQFTNDSKDYSGYFTAFEKIDDKISVVAKGDYNEIKTKCPMMRSMINAYVLYEGAIYRLEIKGSSKAMFSSFEKTLLQDDIYPFQKVVLLKSSVQNGQLGQYYTIDFTILGDSNLEVVAPYVKEVNDKFKAIDDQAARINQTYSQKQDQPQSDGSIQVDEVVEDVGPQAEIDDIPF